MDTGKIKEKLEEKISSLFLGYETAQNLLNKIDFGSYKGITIFEGSQRIPVVVNENGEITENKTKLTVDI